MRRRSACLGFQRTARWQHRGRCCFDLEVQTEIEQTWSRVPSYLLGLLMSETVSLLASIARRILAERAPLQIVRAWDCACVGVSWHTSASLMRTVCRSRRRQQQLRVRCAWSRRDGGGLSALWSRVRSIGVDETNPRAHSSGTTSETPISSMEEPATFWTKRFCASMLRLGTTLTWQQYDKQGGAQGGIRKVCDNECVVERVSSHLAGLRFRTAAIGSRSRKGVVWTRSQRS